MESLEKQLAESEAVLEKREIMIDHAGSIAEASLQLSGIFEAAQLACQQYTENIQKLSERQEGICAQMERQSREEAERLVSEAQSRSDKLMSDTKMQCEEMIAKAKEEAQKYWTDVSGKLENFYQEHAGLREILEVITQKDKQE